MSDPVVKPSLHYVCKPIEYHYQKNAGNISNTQYKTYLLYYGYLPGSRVFESLEHYHNSVLGRNKLIFSELELSIRESKKTVNTLRSKLYHKRINTARIISIVENLWAMHSWLLLNYNVTLESCGEYSDLSYVKNYISFYIHKTVNLTSNLLQVNKLINSIVLLYRYGFDKNIKCNLHTHTNSDIDIYNDSNTVDNTTDRTTGNNSHENIAETQIPEIQIMSYNQISKLFYHLDNAKVRLLFLLLFMCDITPDEVVEIKHKDINFYTQSIKIVNCEYSFEYNIVFPGILKTLLQEALHGYNQNDYIFGKYFLCNHGLTNIENYFNELYARMRQDQTFSLQSFLHTGSRLSALGHFESGFFYLLLYNKGGVGTI